jgi:hypothetical protein
MADRAPFADAERFELEEDGKKQTWVVLAITEHGGSEYALLAPEADLLADSEDMEVAVFRYLRDDDGNKSLEDVADERLYEQVYGHFSELMGLEGSDVN